MSKDNKNRVNVEITDEMILKHFINKNLEKLAKLDISTPSGQREMRKLSKQIAKERIELRKINKT